MSSWGWREPGRKDFSRHLIPPSGLGAINQALWEKGVTLPVSSTDITWNNSPALPGQWESRKPASPAKNPRDDESTC